LPSLAKICDLRSGVGGTNGFGDGLRTAVDGASTTALGAGASAAVEAEQLDSASSAAAAVPAHPRPAPIANEITSRRGLTLR
jgi:hypothetical protein